MYYMCTSHFSFWTMVSWSLLGSSCITCVHQIFPSELWLLGLYLVLHVWHVYIRSLILNYGFLMYLFLHVWHVYIRSFLWNMVSWSTCVHQIFPSELWFLVWSTWFFMYDMCTSDLSFWTMVSWSLSWSFMYDMCTSDLSFWTMVSWSLPVWHVYIRSIPSCVHQIFPSELWFLGLDMWTSDFLHGFLVYLCTSDLSFWTMVSWSLPGHQIFLHVWHLYIRSFLLNYGFLVSNWSCMTCVHQIFLLNYVVLHVWHVYIRFFLLNYGFLGYLVLHVWHVYIRSFLLKLWFLESTWSFMYDMCTSDLSFWTVVS